MAGQLAGADPKIKEMMTNLDDDKIGKIFFRKHFRVNLLLDSHSSNLPRIFGRVV